MVTVDHAIKPTPVRNECLLRQKNCREKIIVKKKKNLIARDITMKWINYQFCYTILAYRARISPCETDGTPLARRSASRN